MAPRPPHTFVDPFKETQLVKASSSPSTRLDRGLSPSPRTSQTISVSFFRNDCVLEPSRQSSASNALFDVHRMLALRRVPTTARPRERDGQRRSTSRGLRIARPRRLAVVCVVRRTSRSSGEWFCAMIFNPLFLFDGITNFTKHVN